MSFTHLTLNTEYSPDTGIITLQGLFSAGKLSGITALCITDTNNLFGAVQLSLLAQTHSIKSIYGSTILIEDEDDIYRLVLLCKTPLGYRSLMNLLGYGLKKLPRYNGLPVYKLNDLVELKDNICITGGMLGMLGSKMLYAPDKVHSTLNAYQQIFTEGNLVIDIHRVFEDQNEEIYNRRAINIANFHGIPIVANNYSCFLHQEEYVSNKVKIAVHKKTVLYGLMQHTCTKEMYFKTAEEMADLFEDLPNAIENIAYIVQRCNVTIPVDHLPLFPRYQQNDYSTNKEALMALAGVGITQKLSSVDPKCIEEHYLPRLNYELEIISSKGFTDYFLIVADFTQWAHKHEIPVGPGRGSGASSLLAYLLDITNVDPIIHDLIFERFLNIERMSYPDFDIDFCIEGRESVINYIRDKYGHEQVSQIISYSSLGAKAVLKDVARALGLNFTEANDITHLIPLGAITIEEALASSNTLYNILHQGKNAVILGHARVLEGLVKTATRHAAGILIAPCPVVSLGIYCGEDDQDHQVIQWDMQALESIGLLKIDCLGLRTLTSIQNTTNRIKQLYQQNISFRDWPDLSDPKVYALINSGKTEGVFQLESLGMQSLLTKLPITRFQDIVAVIALYRPGPLNSGMVEMYINIKNDKQEPEMLHESVKTILEESHGLIIYQEQIMRVASVVAGFSLGRGDILQKAISKKRLDTLVSLEKEFMDGAAARGVSTESASRIFNIIREFSLYGFNKAHATSYALLTYYTAFLKAYYPVPFYLGILSKETQPHKIQRYIVAAIIGGFKILNPCINHSEWEFTYVDQFSMRVGFSHIKGIGYANFDLIIQERTKNGVFSSVENFIARVFGPRTGKKLCEILIEAGAFDIFSADRSYMKAVLDHLFKKVHYSLKIADNPNSRCKPPICPSLVPWQDFLPQTRIQTIQLEVDKLGICLSADVLSLHAFWLQRIGVMRPQSSNHYHRGGGSAVFIYAGVVVDILSQSKRLVIKAIYQKELVYFLGSNIDSYQPIAGDIVIVRSDRPMYLHKFYNSPAVACKQIKHVASEVNCLVSRVIIEVELAQLAAFAYVFSEFCDNYIINKTHEAKLIQLIIKVPQRWQSTELMLCQTLSVSAYCLHYALEKVSKLQYVFY